MALYHSVRGSVDYTIVGSPTIVDGVVSGFSNSDYLNISSGASSNSLEVVISLKDIPQIVNNQGCILRLSGDLNLTVFHQTDGTVRVSYKGSDGNSKYISAFDYANDGSFKIVISSTGAETYYSSDGSSYSAVSSLSVQPYSISFTSAKWGYLSSTLQAFQGSIDLNNTYITVNGQPWFGICPVEVKKHQVMGPVGYTLSGSPSTENGVLKNVSRTNRVYTSLSLPNFETLEVLIKAKKETSWTGRVLCLCGFGSYNSQRRITTNEQTGENQGTRLFFNAAGIIISIDNSKFDVTQYSPLGYYTRLRVTKNTEDYTYELGLSADKESWVTASANYEDNICTGQVYFLQNASGVYAADEMSLDETYIKVNGKLWYWQPRETEKIVVNGVQVWQKSS